MKLPEDPTLRAAHLLVLAMRQQGYVLDPPVPEPDGSAVIGCRDAEVSVDLLTLFSEMLLACRDRLDGIHIIHTVLVRDGRLAFRIT
jgi:hypothetical protein